MTLSKILAGLVATTGFVVVSTLSASAAIVCNDNVCWHASQRYEYPAEARVTIHEDSWKPTEKFTFREHEGRGYWRGDTWVTW